MSGQPKAAETGALSRTTPVFKHDCDSCIYLATVHGHDGPVDWYVHRNDSARGDTMVGRWSDEPSHNLTPHWSEPTAAYWNGNVTALSDTALIAWAVRSLFSSVSEVK